MLNNLLWTCLEWFSSLRPIDYAVLLVGGRSARFYPLGSKLFTQFGLESDLPILGKHSLFQTRLLLFQHVARKIIVVGGEEFQAVALEQSRAVGIEILYLIEEKRRDTAPAFLLALSRIKTDEAERDPVVLLSPSDHFHGEPREMVRALWHGAGITASTGKITTFVVDPRSPSPSFSYLVPGEDGISVHSFVQKPPSSKAEDLIRQGAGWGLGVHIGYLSKLIDAFQTHEAFRSLDADWVSTSPSLNFEGDILCRLDQELLMFNCTSSEWSDLGTAEEVCKLAESRGESAPFGDVTLVGSDNVLRINRSSIPLRIEQVRDMIVALSADHQLLIAPLGQAERLKLLLGEMSEDTPYIIHGDHMVTGEILLLKRLLIFGEVPLTLDISSSRIVLRAL